MVRDQIREKLKACGMTQKQYAEVCGYSESYLSDFLNGRRDPGEAILKAEGLRAVTYYEYDEE